MLEILTIIEAKATHSLYHVVHYELDQIYNPRFCERDQRDFSSGKL